MSCLIPGIRGSYISGECPRAFQENPALDLRETACYYPVMKYTRYFLHTRNRLDRQQIKQKRIYETVRQPDAERVQQDGRIRRWKRISEADGRYLRVVLLEDGETLHNAFFDRRFQE